MKSITCFVRSKNKDSRSVLNSLQIMASKLFRLCLLFLITFGFGYQLSIIAKEYFLYKTSTYVSLKDEWQQNVPPRISLCKYHNVDIYRGQSLKHLFSSNKSSLADTTTFIESELLQPKKGKPHPVPGGDKFELKRFLNSELYCLSVRPKDKMVYKYAVYYATPLTAIYHVVLRSNFLHIPSTCNNWGTGKCVLSLGMTSYDSDLQKPMRTPLIAWINTSIGKVDWSFTYSLTRTTLLSAPYDTNCLNYSRTKHQSRHSCLSSCIRQETEWKWQKIPVENCVIREEYENSSLSLIPFFVDDEENPLKEEEISESVRPIYREYRKIRQDCQRDCNRPECWLESVTPKEMQITHFEEGKQVDTFVITLHPPNQPVVVIRSTPKVALIDFLIYVGSCLSFWYGFCPLNVVDTIQRKIGNSKPQNRIEENPRQLTNRIHINRIYNILERITQEVSQIKTDIGQQMCDRIEWTNSSTKRSKHTNRQ